MDSRRRLSDRHLIAEQPGMTILLTGLILAFFLGYTTKSLLSPSRIAARIEKAASHIHKDVKVSFSSAQLSLSNGILPRFAVIISNVKMEAAEACWGSPIMEIDELRLPLSLLSVLRGGPPVRTIEANTMALTLRSDPTHCSPEESAPEQNAPAPRPAVMLSPSEQSNKYRNDIRGVFVRTLRISSEKHPQYSTELMNFAVKVKSFEPKIIEVTAKSHLLKDRQVGDYLSHANLYLQYKESPEATVQAHFFGNWREGHYSVIANYNLGDQLLAMETDLKHIPLSQILAILQKYDLASRDLNGRQVWLSAKARFSAPLDEIRSSPLEIRDLKMEGDLGEMYVERINITSLEPLKYDPIRIDVKKLDVEKLLVLLNRPKETGILGHLGTFTGRAEIISDQKMRMTGEHSGLEFVFSNKGQRELQVIETMTGDVNLDRDLWTFQIKRVEPRGGVFVGDVRFRADRDFKELEVKSHIDELSLAPPVQKLMTQGGSIGLLSMDGDLRLKQGKVQLLKGLVRLHSMDVEGVSFGKTKATFDWAHDEVVLNTQIQSMQVGPQSPTAQVLKQVTLNSWWKSGNLPLQSVSGVLQSDDLKHLSWKHFQGQVGKTGRLTTEGAWDENAQLKGTVAVKDGKIQRRWQIQGNREQPVFVEKK
ncbi:hypothetical protein EZJ49_09800 [Bdellovibrio bacteriovorus]|uniref:hypothetical protein n=1 Tax=Bdellovibrio bacteriovorus TaxID=959 RepID=UPI0021CF982F|nr:hypothetical protein [Bdellovibrio bacteriovorus]UXR63368.1 hypothetical protein EZJ49_09800 [Bdellovibrio bacteriovorus]